MLLNKLSLLGFVGTLLIWHDALEATTLENLPLDIQKVIFRKLETDDLGNAAQVSKHFKMIADDNKVWSSNLTEDHIKSTDTAQVSYKHYWLDNALDPVYLSIVDQLKRDESTLNLSISYGPLQYDTQYGEWYPQVKLPGISSKNGKTTLIRKTKISKATGGDLSNLSLEVRFEIDGKSMNADNYVKYVEGKKTQTNNKAVEPFSQIILKTKGITKSYVPPLFGGMPDFSKDPEARELNDVEKLLLVMKSLLKNEAPVDLEKTYVEEKETFTQKVLPDFYKK